MTPETNDTSFTQVAEFVIEDLETLKVVADPLRLQIVELVFDHPHTVKQVAQKLDLPPSKLYYHFNLLEKHGLIRIASTRIVSGIVEKSYQTAAHNIRVQRGLLTPQRNNNPKEQGVSLFVDAILEDAKQDIKQNAVNGLINLTEEQHPHSLRIARNTTRFTEEQALEFQARLNALMEEFKLNKENPANLNEQVYALVFAFYPTMRGTRPKGEDTPQDS